MAEIDISAGPPSEAAEDIRGLFLRAGRPEFEGIYERVYRVRERQGLRSWIGRRQGQAAFHISLAPERFSDGAQTLTCGLPGDLMVDATERDFWGPVKLVRRMVADVARDRLADFLLTTYVPRAEAVFKAAAFKPFAELHRQAMPLIWPYPLLRRLMLVVKLPPVRAVPFMDGWSEVPLKAMHSPGAFRPVPHADYYATRIPRIEYPTGTWLVTGPVDEPEAIVLVSTKPDGELVIADVLWRDVTVSLKRIFAAVVRWASDSAKHKVVSITTIPGSHLADAARLAGFVVRGSYRVMIAPIVTPAAVPPPEQWAFTPFVLTSW
jgi:hypothetical protein